MSHSPHRTLRNGILLAGLVAALPACVESNHRLTIGDDVGLAAFTPHPAELPSNDAPSLLSVTRTEWEPVTFRVPADGVGHRPNYRTHWLTDNELARARGEFPTATTAFELGQSGRSGQIHESLIAPFNQFFDVLAMPVLAFMEPQTAELRSPYRTYERTPRGSVLPLPSCCEGPCTPDCQLKTADPSDSSPPAGGARE